MFPRAWFSAGVFQFFGFRISPYSKSGFAILINPHTLVPDIILIYFLPDSTFNSSANLSTVSSMLLLYADLEANLAYLPTILSSKRSVSYTHLRAHET